MINPFLIGERIYLRPLERDDAAPVAAWLNDPEVNRTILHAHPMSVQAEQNWLDKLAESQENIALGIVLKDGDRLIGVTALKQFDWRNRHASFGITIGVKEEWGKGHGTAGTELMVRHAFETLNLNRVWLHVLIANERGIRAYERVGFKREGVLRQHLFREGRFQDILSMAILREDWEARHDVLP
jgi:UDP-4-amino-4,6-dideoxy-N-acetyl-beta-L-altrosamine N-acetyltransferase